MNVQNKTGRESFHTLMFLRKRMTDQFYKEKARLKLSKQLNQNQSHLSGRLIIVNAVNSTLVLNTDIYIYI